MNRLIYVLVDDYVSQVMDIEISNQQYEYMLENMVLDKTHLETLLRLLLTRT